MAWHIVGYGGNTKPAYYVEFLIDFASDIDSPPSDYKYATGSIAHTPGYKQLWEYDANGNWVEIGGD